jgi:SAM-dependent methyltransferase
VNDTSPDVTAHRAWICALVEFERLGALLDVGCGSGADLQEIALRVQGRDAHLVGVDTSARALQTAAAAIGDDARFVFHELRIDEALPFDDHTFDVVFSNNFLECVGDKAAFLQDVARVLRPGGQVICAHWDWDSQAFDGTDKELVRRVVHAYADWQQPWMEHCDPWMGRRLWSVFQSTGKFEGTVHARVLTNTVYAAPWYGHARLADCAALVEQGRTTGEEYARLIREVEQQAAAGRYFYSITGYVYVGRVISRAGS